MIHKRKNTNTNSTAVSNVKMSLLKPYNYYAPALKWAISKTAPKELFREKTALEDAAEFYKNNLVRVGIEKKDKNGNVKAVKIVTFCPIIKKLNSARYEFTPVMGEHEYDAKRRSEQKPVTVSATQILAFNAPFTMVGNKAELYTRQGFSDIVEQFLNGLATALDLFGGTMLNANQWIRRYNCNANFTIVNEYDKARHQTFIDVQNNPEELKGRVETLIKYYQVIFTKQNGRELIAHSLMEGIATGSSAHYIVAQMMSPNGQAVNYDEVYESFKNMTDDSKPAIQMGKTTDTSKLFTDKTKMLNRIIESHKMSKNHQIINRDALEVMREILASEDPIGGYGLYLDPDYVNFEAGSYMAKENAGYNDATAWMKNTKRFCEEVVDALLVPLRARGVKILLTNEYNETLIKHLKKRGFYVAWTTRGNNKPEIVATSFYLYDSVFEQSQQQSEVAAQEAKSEKVVGAYCSSVVATQMELANNTSVAFEGVKVAVTDEAGISGWDEPSMSQRVTQQVRECPTQLGRVAGQTLAYVKTALGFMASNARNAVGNIKRKATAAWSRARESYGAGDRCNTGRYHGINDRHHDGVYQSDGKSALNRAFEYITQLMAKTAGEIFRRAYTANGSAYYLNRYRCDTSWYTKADSAPYRRANYLGLGLDSC